MFTVSPSLTFSMLSSQSVRYTHPVSSPTSASLTLCGSPSLPAATFLTSLLDKTLASTFTAREDGFNSPILTSTGCLAPVNPSTAKILQHPIFSTIQPLQTDRT